MHTKLPVAIVRGNVTHCKVRTSILCKELNLTLTPIVENDRAECQLWLPRVCISQNVKLCLLVCNTSFNLFQTILMFVCLFWIFFPVFLGNCIRKNSNMSIRCSEKNKKTFMHSLWIKENWDTPDLATVSWCPQTGRTLSCVDLLSRGRKSYFLIGFYFGINAKLELRQARCNSTIPALWRLRQGTYGLYGKILYPRKKMI